MNNNSKKNYFLLALVAVAAASIGWGVSALGTNQKTAALTPAMDTAPVANNLIPAASAPLSNVPVADAISTARPVLAEAPAPVKRMAVRSRAARQTPGEETAPLARNESSENSPQTTLPVRDRKKGMGNTAKTAIAIGGGAATGAAIGGIAGGGKGAAIGAAIGGGGGAIYSIIRKKQGKEVW